MTISMTKTRALGVARERGIVRTRDFDAAGVPRAYLRRLRDEGLIIQTKHPERESADLRGWADLELVLQ